MSRFWLGKDKKPNVADDEDYSFVHLGDTAGDTGSPRPPTTDAPDAAPGAPLARVPLQGGELEAVVCVVTYLISEYRTM